MVPRSFARIKMEKITVVPWEMGTMIKECRVTWHKSCKASAKREEDLLLSEKAKSKITVQCWFNDSDVTKR